MTQEEFKKATELSGTIKELDLFLFQFKERKDCTLRGRINGTLSAFKDWFYGERVNVQYIIKNKETREEIIGVLENRLLKMEKELAKIGNTRYTCTRFGCPKESEKPDKPCCMSCDSIKICKESCSLIYRKCDSRRELN